MKNKITKILLIISALIIISCGKGNPPHEIDPYFSAYIQNFKDEADKNKIGYGDIDKITVIKFKNLSKTTDGSSEIGTCLTYHVSEDLDEYDYKEIDIDVSFRDSNDEIFKNEVFMHEIGHCAYGLQHVEGVNRIMNPNSEGMSQKDFETAKTDYFISAKDNEANWFK